MIISYLSGRLGNQMFIWATGYALAKENNQKFVVYKLPCITKQIKQKYELSCFKLDKDTKYYSVPLSLNLYTIKLFLARVLKRFNLNFRVKTFTPKQCERIREKHMSYSKIELSADKKDHILTGYWQSPKYFDKYREDIIRQLQPNFKLSKLTENMIDKVTKSTYSVSIHIREGDFVNNNACLSMDYYKKAMALISKDHPDSEFFVFSDNYEWSRKGIDSVSFKVTFMERESEKSPFEDIWVMSKCNANIIANSSYGWWGAYLNTAKDKVVIAPHEIFSTLNYDAAKEDWIII